MNNEPTFVKLLCLSVGTSVTISIALGTGFGLAGVVIGVVLGVLGGTIIGIVLTAAGQHVLEAPIHFRPPPFC